MSMKLAEALILRADLQKRLAQLRQRILQNAKTQEGDAPAEDPAALIAEFEAAAADLQGFIARINRTNLAVATEAGQTMTDALAERDVLRLRAALYREAADAATQTRDRYTRSEVKYVRAIDVAATREQADALSKALRTLDAQIQAANWQHELLA
ncbi:MAG: DIP1984 family protein [Bacteroidota bacterium]